MTQWPYRSKLFRFLYGKCEGTCNGDTCKLSANHPTYCEGSGDHGWSYQSNGEVDCPEHIKDLRDGQLLSVSALITNEDDAERDEEVSHAWQWAIKSVNGKHYIYGDQSWVAYGGSREEGETVVVRDVYISYGEWREPNV